VLTITIRAHSPVTFCMFQLVTPDNRGDINSHAWTDYCTQVLGCIVILILLVAVSGTTVQEVALVLAT